MEKHMLILSTTSDFVGKFETENVRILKGMGYTVHYAANMREPPYLSEEERLRNLGLVLHPIDIARSPFMIENNQKALGQILRIIRSNSIRLIHCHTPVGGVLGRLAGKLSPQKPFVIYTAHGFHFYHGAPLLNQLVYRGVEKTLAPLTDVLITINEEDYRSAQKFRLKKGGKLYKIPGTGLNLERFSPLSPEHRLENRKKLHIKENDFFLLSVGELNQNKNHQVVLKALYQMKERGDLLSSLRYGICGDGFYRETLQRWIKEMGLEQVVTLYGYCQNIPEILGCADAFLFPSIREGLGMAGLEALAMGIPVLAADNRGTREYMEHKRNGLIFRYDDMESLIEGISMLRRMSPGEKAMMRKHCLNSVRPFALRYTSAMMQRIYAEADQKIGWDEYESAGDHQRSNGRS